MLTTSINEITEAFAENVYKVIKADGDGHTTSPVYPHNNIRRQDNKLNTNTNGEEVQEAIGRLKQASKASLQKWLHILALYI